MHYLLTRDRQVVTCDNLQEWAIAWGTASNQIARTVIGTAVVSTVFLGLDHNFGIGPPILFETMIFDKRRPRDYMERYSTIEEAQRGHARAVYHVDQLLRKACLSRTSRNAREGRYLVRLARAAV
jgi:hypothetical protein